MKKRILAVLVATVFPLTAVADDSASPSFASEEGASFERTLRILDAAAAEVAHDIAVSHLAKCGSALSLEAIQAEMETPEGKEAYRLTMNVMALTAACDQRGERCLEDSKRAEYLRLVTGRTCNTDDRTASALSRPSNAVVRAAIAERREKAIADPSAANEATLQRLSLRIIDLAAAWADLSVELHSEPDAGNDADR